LEENKNTAISEKEISDNIYRSYNYVGVKETVAYLLNDFSNTFGINDFKERFIWDVVKIDFGISAIVNIFTSAWDVINDVIIATVVDNTRTRLGKFRPYLIGMQIPLTILGMLYWLIPAFFPNTDGTYMPKLIVYFAFLVIQETASTFTSVAKSGYMSTITPNPNERIRLITLAELLTGYMGEDLPRYIFGAVYDLINAGKLQWKLSSTFMAFGLVTGTISALFTLYFFIVSKERVPQSIDRPNVKEGLKAIFTNYPVLLICLSDFLAGFAVSSTDSNYFIDVHGSYSLITLANIPSGLNGSISYAFVSPMRKKFSSKALWVGADMYGDILNVAYFLFGWANKNYLKKVPMVIALGVREWFYKWSFGVNKVINTDLWNEAMDYCEWKNGYRMEATTGVAKNLVLKIQTSVMTSIRSVILDKIGYVQGLKIGTQDVSTKFWLFALSSIIPFLTGILGIVPKMLWPINQKKRDQMYDELSVRRNKMVSEYNENFATEPKTEN
jgi:glycoside/pentoside/hexuronide:cation symporter, GPH family